MSIFNPVKIAKKWRELWRTDGEAYYVSTTPGTAEYLLFRAGSAPIHSVFPGLCHECMHPPDLDRDEHGCSVHQDRNQPVEPVQVVRDLEPRRRAESVDLYRVTPNPPRPEKPKPARDAEGPVVVPVPAPEIPIVSADVAQAATALATRIWLSGGMSRDRLVAMNPGSGCPVGCLGTVWLR